MARPALQARSVVVLAALLGGCGGSSASTQDVADGGADSNSARDSCVVKPFFHDADRDGYGDPKVRRELCDLPPGYVDNAADCDDACDSCRPGAPERCDARDNDCDGGIDEGVTRVFHRDADGDGFGHPSLTTEACSAPDGFVFDSTDCDDACASCRPGATEICDGLDNDCEGSIDQGFSPSYQDCDGDRFPPAGAQVRTECAAPVVGPTACPSGSWTSLAPASGRVDCDDGIAGVNPGNQAWHAEAIAGKPDDYDWNCDGVEQQGYTNTAHACVLSGTSCLGYWTSDAAVACGGSALFQDCESTIADGGLACVEKGTADERAQVCR